MQGKYPRSIYIVLTNPLPGKEAEFNYWYNYVHVPDGLGWGTFDRVYRYKAVEERPERFLAIWESDYTDLTDGLAKADRDTEDLIERGRLWPVFERAWSRPFASIGPTAPPNQRAATLITTTQMSCAPEHVEAFARWHDDLHVGQSLGAGSYHTVYRFQRADQPSGGAAEFLTVYESDADPAASPDSALDWFEPVDETHVRPRDAGASLPEDFVIQVAPHWRATWLPIWP